MKLKLEIDIDQETMSYEDLAQFLAKQASRIQEERSGCILEDAGMRIKDINGNRIGAWTVEVDEEEEEDYTPRPFVSGDHCRLIHGPRGEQRVEHWDCDEHPNGTITDNATGKIVTE